MIRLDPSLTLGTGAFPPRPPQSVRPTTVDAVGPSERGERAGGPIRSSDYLRNGDGDDAVLGSRRGELTREEQAEVEKLRKRDQEVRTHEQAHLAAAGPLARGGASYTYKRGPDANRYAVDGSVEIDTSEGRTPEETIAKAQQMKRAALAPAQPSGADRAVAAKASRLEAEARAELVKKKEEAGEEAAGPGGGPGDAPGGGRASAPGGSSIDFYA